jgi:hypothetical protein
MPGRIQAFIIGSVNRICVKKDKSYKIGTCSLINLKRQDTSYSDAVWIVPDLFAKNIGAMITKSVIFIHPWQW